MVSWMNTSNDSKTMTHAPTRIGPSSMTTCPFSDVHGTTVMRFSHRYWADGITNADPICNYTLANNQLQDCRIWLIARVDPEPLNLKCTSPWPYQSNSSKTVSAVISLSIIALPFLKIINWEFHLPSVAWVMVICSTSSSNVILVLMRCEQQTHPERRSSSSIVVFCNFGAVVNPTYAHSLSPSHPTANQPLTSLYGKSMRSVGEASFDTQHELALIGISLSWVTFHWANSCKPFSIKAQTKMMCFNKVVFSNLINWLSQYKLDSVPAACEGISHQCDYPLNSICCPDYGVCMDFFLHHEHWFFESFWRAQMGLKRIPDARVEWSTYEPLRGLHWPLPKTASIWHNNGHNDHFKGAETPVIAR